MYDCCLVARRRRIAPRFPGRDDLCDHSWLRRSNQNGTLADDRPVEADGLMTVFSSQIDALLAEYHVLSLSVCAKGLHWAAPLFYVFDAPRPRLLFVTDPETIHGGMLEETGNAAVTVSGQESTIATLRGLQMWGRAIRLPPPEVGLASQVYNRTFAVPARLMPIYWSFSPTFIKATDNRKGFGHKEKWGRNPFVDDREEKQTG